jgi:two-component system, LytTR family, sensor kinase
MMKLVKYRYFNFVLHALAWSLVLLLPYFVSDAGNEYRIGPLPGVYFTLSGIIHMFIFYTNSLLLYPKLFNRTYWLLYIASVILMIILSYQVKFFILSHWFPQDLLDAKSHVLFPCLVVFTVSVFYRIAVERLRAEKLQKENEAIKLEMELKFLRSQISPHFLFNILTNLVALARKKSDHLEKSLVMLSGLMRYMLNNADKKISLQQEVEYLESYIELQKLRYEPDVKIVFETELSDEKNCCIEPMLLIPFVENAFKHGTGYVDEPTIDIQLTVQEGMLDFDVKNKFDCATDTSKDESSGIGLANVRSRLRLLYPERHQLIVRSDKNFFIIHLTIKLL